jgi:hypothetical protein
LSGAPDRNALTHPVRAERGAAMSRMTGETWVVVGGVDTHSQTHHVAVIDQLGREVDDREFPATAVGYAALAGWLPSFGELARVGVEATSSYGAGLARHLRQAGVSVQSPGSAGSPRAGQI